jgi:hypothetical protein
MANKKTKRRSNWSPPRTASLGSGGSRSAAPERADSGNSGNSQKTLKTPAPPAKRAVQTPPVNRQTQAAAANRQARKEEARRQREAFRKKAARRRTLRTVGIAVGAAVVVVGIVLALTLRGGGKPAGKQGIDPATLPGILKTAPPWPANNTQLKDRLDAMGFPILSAEGVTQHIHMDLQVFVNGKQEEVPALIGIGSDANGTFFSDLHTHDATGIVHLESQTNDRFTLGQFFDVWGVYFTKSCVGSLCTSGDQTLQVFDNGTKVSGDPTKIVFRQHHTYVVAYGTPDQLPNPIPDSYPPNGP